MHKHVFMSGEQILVAKVNDSRTHNNTYVAFFWAEQSDTISFMRGQLK